MIQTNIRLITGGTEFTLLTRILRLDAPDITEEMINLACSRMRTRFGMASARFSGNELIVVSDRPVPPLDVEFDDWKMTAQDTNRSFKLELRDKQQWPLWERLVERIVATEVAKQNRYWLLDDSARIFYECQPFCVEQGVAAYRRFEVASVAIDSSGIGVVVDLAVAFFSNQSLEYFFAQGVSRNEQRNRQQVFERLAGRQQQQRGTLLYDTGRRKLKCYFAEAPEELVCGNTGVLRIRGCDYPSLYHYDKEHNTAYPVTERSRAVKVSFRGIDHAQPVAACRLRVRIMNENLPGRMRSVDKVEPRDRRRLLGAFWDTVGLSFLGGKLKVEERFWCPNQNQLLNLGAPKTSFADGRVIESAVRSDQGLQKYYRDRLTKLRSGGCYSVLPSVSRTIFVAVPETEDKECAEALAESMAVQLKDWTRIPFTSRLVGYRTIQQAIDQLRRSGQPGAVVFVLNSDPAAYHDVAYHLSEWRIKRINPETLAGKYPGANSADPKKLRKWSSFVELCALDLLQQLDCLPFRVESIGVYEAQVAIDVGEDRRHFAVSLLLVRSETKTPNFVLTTKVEHKPDVKNESINHVLLRDTMIDVFKRIRTQKFMPVESLLVLRDGRECGNELQGVDDAVEVLKGLGILTTNCLVDVADFHKRSLKGIRIWDELSADQVVNTLEGVGIQLQKGLAVINGTGRATLHQGTAEPYMISANGRCHSLLAACQSAFAGAQLNFSSPSVAQKFTICLKRTDEDLRSRSAQEIRRLR